MVPSQWSCIGTLRISIERADSHVHVIQPVPYFAAGPTNFRGMELCGSWRGVHFVRSRGLSSSLALRNARDGAQITVNRMEPGFVVAYKK